VIGRGIGVHVALLGVAVAASVFVWTRDKKPAVSAGDVTIWSARAADVEKVAYEAKGRKISLEARSDARGRWYFGTAESPGAGAAPTKTTFVSVTQGGKLADSLAPLKAIREIGRIDDGRTTEFGLRQPEGSLVVVIAGKERRLDLGGQAPGGGSRYVRDTGSGTVYALKGDVLHDLEVGEFSLLEHDLHGFKDADIKSVRVSAQGKTRDVLRSGPDAKRIWATPASPDTQDETAANWLSKVDRLKPNDFVTPQPSAPPVIARLDYQVRGEEGAFLEIAKIPAPPVPAPLADSAAAAAAPKPDYLVRSERTRLWAKVNTQFGEQVEQDLASILK
jgi:hypothetical protein